MSEISRRLTRTLLCPICGSQVKAEGNGVIPETLRIPDHVPVGMVNLCAGFVITVSIKLDKCASCGVDIVKHPSGLCQKCYGGEARGEA